jgi:hypothetical protein
MADVKKCLQYYENYNPPPSANSLLWKKQKKERRTMVTIEMKASKETKSVRKGQEGSISLDRSEILICYILNTV